MSPARQADASERELVLSAQAGAPEALEQIVRLHQEGLWRLGNRLLGSPADAQDLVQETFVSALRNLQRFQPGRPLRPWLVTIATRLGLNMLRSRRRARSEPLGAIEPADPGDGPAGEVERRLEMERLMRAVSTLDAIPRAIVVLHYSEGMTCGEIGAVLEMTESAVKVALFRARERLRTRLGGTS